MAVLAVDPMPNHLKGSLVKKFKQSVRGAARKQCLLRTTRFDEFWRIDPGYAYFAVTQFEGVAVDHARHAAARPA